MGKFEKPRTQKPKQPKPTAAQKKQAAGNAGKRGGRGEMCIRDSASAPWPAAGFC